MKSIQKINGFFWVLFLNLFASPIRADSNRISLPEETLVDLGMGYNSVTGEFGERCVRGSVWPTPKDLVHELAHKSEFELKKIEDVSALKGGLELNLGASFGLGSYLRDPKVSYFSANDPGHNNVTLMVRSRVVTQVSGVTDLHLQERFSSLVAPSVGGDLTRGKTDFLVACGNQFIQSISWGGEFLALVSFEAETEVKRRKISGVLGAFIAWANGQGELSHNFSEETRGSRISTKIFQRGGIGEGPAIEVDKIVEYARNFPSKVTVGSGSVPLSAETRSYGVIYGVSKSNYINLSSQESVLKKYEEANVKARALVSQWEQVQGHPDDYVAFEGSRISRILSELKAILGKVEKSAHACVSDLLDGCTYEEPVWPDQAIPARRPQTGERWPAVSDPDRDPDFSAPDVVMSTEN